MESDGLEDVKIIQSDAGALEAELIRDGLLIDVFNQRWGIQFTNLF